MQLYVKLRDGYLIFANRVEESSRREFDEKLVTSLTIERQDTTTESKVLEYTEHLKTSDLSVINVYEDEACTKLSVTYRNYIYVRSVSCRIQIGSILHSIILGLEAPAEIEMMRSAIESEVKE